MGVDCLILGLEMEKGRREVNLVLLAKRKGQSCHNGDRGEYTVWFLEESFFVCGVFGVVEPGWEESCETS